MWGVTVFAYTPMYADSWSSGQGFYIATKPPPYGTGYRKPVSNALFLVGVEDEVGDGSAGRSALHIRRPRWTDVVVLCRR